MEDDDKNRKTVFLSELAFLSASAAGREQVAMLHLKSMPDTVLPQMLLHKANPALGAWHVKTMPVRIVGDLPAGAAARALTN
ncbi:MAG: hypothetical protein J6I60_03915 [Bacteroidaceae bacterium]|nr:hypothetical protein [Bacteroidaceae bacterium]